MNKATSRFLLNSNPSFTLLKPLTFLSLIIFCISAMGYTMGFAQEKIIKLNPPNLKRGLPVMEALAVKASATEWSDKELSLQDLSDLMWAANGLNRPEQNKTTASSAQNAHDTDIYLFMKDGVYLYDFVSHTLNLVLTGDYRKKIMMTPPPPPKPKPGEPPRPPRPAPSNPPIEIILISDISRFKFGPPELKPEWGAIGTGIISQNISLFCAATDIKTRPKASIEKGIIKDLLKLKDSQLVLLNHPVGYAK